MSILSNKSSFNLDAAKVLIKKNLYAPSVHCSYYAVFQKIKCLYVSKKGISFNDLSQKIIKDRRNTHTYIIEEFCNFTQDIRKRRVLKKRINDLKSLRNKSDYDDLEISIEISSSALKKSEEILNDIKN